MKRFSVIFLIIVCLVFCSQFVPPSYRRLVLPDPLPPDMEDMIALDTVLGYSWVVYDYQDSVIYPTFIGYKSVTNVRSLLTRPSIKRMMNDAEVFFFMNPTAKYYENYYIKVFVSKKKSSDYKKDNEMTILKSL